MTSELLLLIKHTKNFSIKNFGAPKTPPPKILYVWACSCVFKRKEAPKHKEFTGVRGPLRGGGSRRGVSGKIPYVYAFFRGLTSELLLRWLQSRRSRDGLDDIRRLRQGVRNADKFIWS